MFCLIPFTQILGVCSLFWLGEIVYMQTLNIVTVLLEKLRQCWCEPVLPWFAFILKISSLCRILSLSPFPPDLISLYLAAASGYRHKAKKGHSLIHLFCLVKYLLGSIAYSFPQPPLKHVPYLPFLHRKVTGTVWLQLAEHTDILGHSFMITTDWIFIASYAFHSHIASICLTSECVFRNL